MTLALCCQRTVLFGIGGVFFVVGLIMASLWPVIFNSVLRTHLALSKGSKTYDMWSETPIPMYIDIYLFNWTNHEDTLKNGHKPILQEVGPFVFSEHRSKVNVKWNEDETITYQNRHKWVYHPEMSNGHLNDTITNFNVVLMTIRELCKKLGPIQRMVVNPFLNFEENVVITKTVDELLFKGYNDPVLKTLSLLHGKFPKYFPATLDKFGWFYMRNMSDTADGTFKMETGLNDISKLGDVLAWNGKNRLNFYSGDCSQIKGSLGELWAPRSSYHNYITLFASDICSALKLTSSGNFYLHNLTGTIFAGGEDVFDNGTNHPESACYCSKDSEGKCPASGVRNISSCRGGAPVFMSYPHFYLADPFYSSAVEGLNPNAENHTFKMILEQNTGVPLKVNARLQINIHVEPIDNMGTLMEKMSQDETVEKIKRTQSELGETVKWFGNLSGLNLEGAGQLLPAGLNVPTKMYDSTFKVLPRIYMPMMWFNQHTEMTPELAANIVPLAKLADFGPWVLIGLAVTGLLLIAVGVLLRLRRHRMEDSTLNTEYSVSD